MSRVRCPAKINLALRVLDRRSDGYHELDTLFQTIDLWDELEVRPATELSLRCDDPGVPVDDSNLVLRAARALHEHCGGDGGGALFLRKRIPVRGGLGGGSSDAAGALRLLGHHWGVAAESDALQAIAAGLGADVPFFLTGGTARGRGRGDRIEPLPDLGELPLLLGCPPFGVPTGEAFARASTRLTLPGNGVSLPPLSAHKWQEHKDFGFAVNDLEQVVFEGWPELERFRNRLRDAGARRALLSGSGSTVYGIFRSDDEARTVAGLLGEEFADWRLLPTRTVKGAAQLVQ